MRIPEAARLMNVSPRMVERACSVFRYGTTELIELMESLAVTITDAESIVKESAEVQRQAVADVKQGKSKSLRRAVEARRTAGSGQVAKESVIDAAVRKLICAVDAKAKQTDCAPGYGKVILAIAHLSSALDEWQGKPPDSPTDIS